VTEFDIISAEWKPLATLLAHILDQVAAELPGAMGISITVQHQDGQLEILATTGVDALLTSAQVDQLGGPVLDAAEHDEPVLTVDLWADPRWPGLTVDEMTQRAPAAAEALPAVRGAAALSTAWDRGTLVLSCTLDHAADLATLAVLDRYEPLVSAALLVAIAGTEEGTRRMLTLTQSRAAIEQAKGAVMGLRRCDAADAWAALRRASQEFNVKVRELAVALVEYLGDAPAEQPEDGPTIRPEATARRAARQVWQALSLPDLGEQRVP
jgi:hypothetical protein